MALWTLRFKGGGETEVSFGAARLVAGDGEAARPFFGAIRIALRKLRVRLPCSAEQGEMA
jgi:hypothetical protein